MFTTNKQKGYGFFQTTRVESCNHVKLVNGKPVAVPFVKKPKQSFADKMAKSSETTSMTQ